jgi:hypothetical protein
VLDFSPTSLGKLTITCSFWLAFLEVDGPFEFEDSVIFL